MKVVDLKQPDQVTAEKTLNASLKENFSDVFVVGIREDDQFELLVSGSYNPADIVFILDQLKLKLLTGDYQSE